MKPQLIQIFVVLLVLVGLPQAGWRMYLACVIRQQLATIPAARLPANGEELTK